MEDSLSEFGKYLNTLEQKLSENAKDKTTKRVEEYISSLEEAEEKLTDYLIRIYNILSKFEFEEYETLSGIPGNVGEYRSSVPINPPIEIKIEDENERARALGALLMCGTHDMLFIGRNRYGLFSEEQLKLLLDRNIKFKRLI